MVDRNTLLQSLDALLEPGRFKDYGPNGLQVEGRSEIRTLISGVTASRALIEAAVEARADAVFVHHGLFWRGQDGRLTGWLRERVALLLRHDINLFAYHLPLDAHPQLGNNAALGARLGWHTSGHFGDQDLGCLAELPEPGQTLAECVNRIEAALGRRAVWVGDANRTVRRVAWCTGGAQSYFEAAMAQGADLFLTGEISEPQAHLARESGVAFVAAGHHATERYGAPSVAAHISAMWGLEHRFIDIDNPA